MQQEHQDPHSIILINVSFHWSLQQNYSLSVFFLSWQHSEFYNWWRSIQIKTLTHQRSLFRVTNPIHPSHLLEDFSEEENESLPSPSRLGWLQHKVRVTAGSGQWHCWHCDKAQPASHSLSGSTSACEIQLSNTNRLQNGSASSTKKISDVHGGQLPAQTDHSGTNLFKDRSILCFNPSPLSQNTRTVSILQDLFDFSTSEENNPSRFICSHSHRPKYSLHFCHIYVLKQPHSELREHQEPAPELLLESMATLTQMLMASSTDISLEYHSSCIELKKKNKNHSYWGWWSHLDKEGKLLRWLFWVCCECFLREERKEEKRREGSLRSLHSSCHFQWLNG